MHGFIPLFDARASRELDARATALLRGDDYVLMQRAGQAAWQALLQRWPQAMRICVVCGPGNNGGDGYVLARLAQQSRRQVRVLHLAEHSPRTALAQRACTEYVSAGGRIDLFPEVLPQGEVIVDALFGIGLSRAPDEASAALIAAINAQSAPVFSLDVPSGLDADVGTAPGSCVNADATLQFIAAHIGLHTGDALDLAGECVLDDLDVPPETFTDIAPQAELIGLDALSWWLLPRPRNTHKGESGRVLCIGGDLGHGGAITLCAEAALRSGAGLLSVATRQAHVPVILARRPEAMPVAVESADDLQSLIANAGVIALGPGLGQGEWAQAVYRQALSAAKPLVVDADALNLLAQAPGFIGDVILTPHPGEAARLLGVSTEEIQRNRPAAAQALVERYNAVVVLKGAGSIVAAPNAAPRIIGAGNPGMAVGGMGDVLTGVIAALRAQGLSAFDAASAGALLHALAGDAAAIDGERGLLPSDLMPYLRRYANPELID